MNIKKNIKKKSEELIRKAKTLPNIPIKWEEPILIKCAELNTKDDLEPLMNVFENHKTKPGIYYFEIVSKHRGQDIVAALSSYKNLKLRSCPKIVKKRSTDTTSLYCGSRKDGLHGRFIQHLGFGSQNTFVLQLTHWTKDVKLELKFYYTWLKEDYKEFTELVESALAEKINPMVGKIA